jgi:hypothetical protein
LCRIETQSSQTSFGEPYGGAWGWNLRNYVVQDQQDWVDHLELAEFCYNNLEYLATRATPF